MKITLHQIKIKDIVNGYKDNAEEGVIGYNGKLYTNGTYYVWETNGYSICMNYTFDETGKLVK